MKTALKLEQKIIAALKKERKKQGVSVYKLAQKTGLSQNAIALIEKGERHPTLWTCLRIAEALEINLTDVINPLEG